MQEGTTKICSECSRALDLGRFYWVSKSSGKLRGQCKDCMRDRKAAQRHPDWRPACSRCGVVLPTRAGSGRRLCSDCFVETYDQHDVRPNGSHRRRLKPCSLCNYSRLPRFGEDVEMLQRAAAYLAHPPARAVLAMKRTA
jgi:NMD protein affecting ribosome stability and mRNA decay